MKQISLSQLAVFVPLFGVSICQAIVAPSVAGKTLIVPRAESTAAPLPSLYGEKGIPEIWDLIGFSRWQNTLRYNMDLDVYTNILSAFMKSHPDWVQTWFANELEQKNLEKTTSLGKDEMFMLRYDSNDGMRHPVAVSPIWPRAGYLPPEDEAFANNTQSPSWWSWGLLQGAYNGTNTPLDAAELITAISGYTLRQYKLEPDRFDEYWDLFIQAHRSPMWIRDGYTRNWSTVMYTTGTGPEDGVIHAQHCSGGQSGLSGAGGKFTDFNKTMASNMPDQVYFLAGVPDFRDGKRKGEIKY